MLVAVFLLVSSPVAAAEFLGVNIEPAKSLYLVLKDANVRAKPETKSEKIGTVRQGGHVRAAGVAKGGAGWVAVVKDGKPFGFVYATALTSIIDGKLKKELIGSVRLENGIKCDYIIRYRGRSEVEGEPIEIADYDLISNCRDKGKRFRFFAPMFMTEGAYDLSEKQVYQINIDIVEIRDGPDNVFSTVTFYHAKQRKVVFDSVTIKSYAGKKPLQSISAATVPDALNAAAEIAFKSWNSKVWKVLVEIGG
ncbi:MAG TPA: hypothetical protein ENI55_06470 [Alphaproteobacteria bacterium]|nr:hypothetical protein [Alphaproteobacteria bacterium]